MARRKRPSEEFDVTEFLRPTDADMRSALTSLLHGEPAAPEPPEGEPHPEGNLPSDPISPSEGRRLPQAEPDPVPDLPPAARGRNPRYIRAIRAQDGHSTSEEFLYQTLWQEGRAEGADTRIVTIGYRGISSLTRMDPKTVKYLCRNLTEKLAVERIGEENVAEGIGRTYRVFSPQRVLDRRQAAGMEWILRKPGGRVEFITGGNLHPEGKSDRVSNSPNEALSIPEGKSSEIYRRSAPALFQAVARAFLEIVPGTEDDAVETLIAGCMVR